MTILKERGKKNGRISEKNGRGIQRAQHQN